MRHWKLTSTVLGLLVVSLFYYGAPVSGQEKTILLTYSMGPPATHVLSVSANDWGKEIEKRTNGVVKFRMFFGGTLTPAGKSYDGAVKGISDVAQEQLSLTMGRFPLTEVLDYPLGFKNCVIPARLANEYYNRFKPKEFDDVKVLYFYSVSPFVFHTNKPVNKLEDLRGMKIRSSGIAAKTVAALGGTPVALPIFEAYDSLSRGVVDSVMSPLEALESFKFAEVTKFTTESISAGGVAIICAVMNKGKWSAIPPDIQKVIEEVNREWSEKTAKAVDELENSARAFSLKLGHKFIRLSEEEEQRWAKAIEPLFDEYVKDKKAKGLPAEEVLRFCRERLKQL